MVRSHLRLKKTPYLVVEFVYTDYMKNIDLTGQRFGRLTVTRREGSDPISQQKRWLCACDCGTTVFRTGNVLKRKGISNCGCLTSDLKSGNSYSRTHGHSGSSGKASREYVTWCSMIQRCTNQKHASFKNYGGRGVSVYASWIASFDQFLADMGPRPNGHSIDRINHDGDYEPTNCRWASKEDQQNNRRDNRTITVEGKQMTASQFARLTGIPSRTILNRLKKLDRD